MSAHSFQPDDGIYVLVDFRSPIQPFVTLIPHTYRNSVLSVEVPPGFHCDFASIPRFLRSIFPGPGKYSRAALIHDWLYYNRISSRVVADAAFLSIMEEDGVSFPVRYAFYLAVRLFGSGAWNSNRSPQVTDTSIIYQTLRNHLSDSAETPDPLPKTKTPPSLLSSLFME